MCLAWRIHWQVCWVLMLKSLYIYLVTSSVKTATTSEWAVIKKDWRRESGASEWICSKMFKDWTDFSQISFVCSSRNVNVHECPGVFKAGELRGTWSQRDMRKLFDVTPQVPFLATLGSAPLSDSFISYRVSLFTVISTTGGKVDLWTKYCCG